MAGNTTETEYGKQTDEELVSLAREGDKEAEQTLILRFIPLVYLKCRSYYLKGAEKKDLVQEGCIGLIGAIRDYDASRGVDFRPYAEVCITNNILAAVKRSTRDKHRPLNEFISLDLQIGGDEDNPITLGERLEQPAGNNPEELAILHESQQRFSRSLSQLLTELEMRVLELFIGGNSYKQIAEKLGKSPKTVDNALQRVKRKVAALMKEDDE